MSVAILLVPSPSKEAYGSPSSPPPAPYTNKGKTGKVNVYFIPYSLNK